MNPHEPSSAQPSGSQVPATVPPSAGAALARPYKSRWRDPALMAAAAIVAFFAWQWLETRDDVARIQEEVARRLSEGDTAAKEARALARQNQEILQAMQAKIGALESRLAESQSQQAALDSLYQEFSRTRDERALAEVEQAIVIAAQQLQLASNVPAALAALQSAEARLSRIDRPRLLPLRKLIARDIERLKTLPVADVATMAVQLDTMLGRIDGLPLGFEHSPALPRRKAHEGKQGGAAGTKPGAHLGAPTAPAEAAEPGFLGGLVGDLWLHFRELVRIERLDRPEPPLMAPEQAAYLRENLRLRLLSARLALLQRDGKVFNEDVRQARQWLERYFDTSARPVAVLVAELRQIEGARLAVDLPSLAETEAAVRALAGR